MKTSISMISIAVTSTAATVTVFIRLARTGVPRVVHGKKHMVGKFDDVYYTSNFQSFCSANVATNVFSKNTIELLLYNASLI